MPVKCIKIGKLPSVDPTNKPHISVYFSNLILQNDIQNYSKIYFMFNWYFIHVLLMREST